MPTLSAARHPAQQITSPSLESPPSSRAIASIALMLASPMAVLPSGMNPFTFPKLTLAAGAVTLAMSASRRGRLPSAVLRTAALGLALFVIAGLLTSGVRVTLVGRLPRYEGLVTIALYLLCAMAGARVLGRPSSATVRAVQTWTAVSACILGAFSVLDQMRISPIGYSEAQRTGSLLGNATDQGVVAMIFLSLLVRAAFRRRDPLVAAGLVAAMVTVGLSGSRAAIGACFLVFLVHLVTSDRRRAPVALGAMAALALAVLVLPQSRERLLVGSTFRSRVLAWQESLSLARDHWLTGAGPSGYSDAIGRFQDAEWVRVAGSEAKPDSPHSWIVQAFTTGGAPLLLCALALAAILVRHGFLAMYRRLPPARTADQVEWVVFHDRRDLGIALFAAMLGYGAALAINFTTPSTTCLAAFVTGGAVAVFEPTRERRWTRTALRCTACGLTLTMGLSAIAEVALRNGAELATAGRIGDARARFEVASTLRPLDPDVHMVAAEYFAQRASAGDQGAARATVEHARASLAVTPRSYETEVALGVGLLATGELVRALGVLNAAVADYPYRGQAYIQRALVLIGLDQPQAGIRDLQRAIVLRPKDPTPVRILLGLAARVEAARAARGRSGDR